MFAEFFNSIGTKNYDTYDFVSKVYGCTEGLTVQVDKFSDAQDSSDLTNRQEQLLISTGFLDRHTDQAFDCLAEILATPNFDDPSNISDLLKSNSIRLANNIGNNGL